MSDVVVHALVRARHAQIAAEAARARTRRTNAEPSVSTRGASSERGSATTLLAQGALRDYLTAL